jgi:hypothetical protein
MRGTSRHPTPLILPLALVVDADGDIVIVDDVLLAFLSGADGNDDATATTWRGTAQISHEVALSSLLRYVQEGHDHILCLVQLITDRR